MDKELMDRFIAEIAEDYEKHGQGKEMREWLLEAVKRHIIGVDDAKAAEIADDIISGVNIYREVADKNRGKDPLDSIKEKISPQDREYIEQETRLIAETAVQEIETVVEEAKQYGH